MPPKTKRYKQRLRSLEKARESKRRKLQKENGTFSVDSVGPGHSSQTEVPAKDPSEPADVLTTAGDALDTDDEERDPTFNNDSSMEYDEEVITETFCEEWVSSLDRKDRISLGLFLCFQLSKQFQLRQTETAEIVGLMVGRSDRTVREWKSAFFENGGEIPEGKQGKYKRTGLLWTSEELNQKATKFIKENAHVEGQPNLTVRQFCQWVNDVLIPNESLQPDFPNKISKETARRWMHELGFKALIQPKGAYIWH